MNPNAPSWGNQGGQQGNQQGYNPYAQQQGYNPYAQQQFNPYAQQQFPQQQYNPYAQQAQQQQFNQAQQQYYQQQQAQFQQQQQQQQQFNQQQYNNNQGYNNNNNSNNNKNQGYNNQQGYNYNQGGGYNQNQNQNQYNNNQGGYNQNSHNNNSQYRNNNNNDNNDNWDDEDEPQQQQPQYGNVKIAQNNNRNNQDLDKSDDDGNNADKNNNNNNNDNNNQQQGQKKKKRKRGGRKKNKNKNKDNNNNNNNNNNDSNNNSNTNANNNNNNNNNDSKDNSNNTSTTQSPQKPVNDKDNVDMADLNDKVAKLNVEPDKPRPTPKVESKKETKAKPEPEKNSDTSDSNKQNAKSNVEPQAKKDKKSKPKSKSKSKSPPQEEEEKVIESKKDKKKKKKVKWDAHDPREHLNLVLIGHVDAGKSTISGQILLATNQIDTRTIAKYKKEAKEKNRESWWIAYIMDEDDEERNKGKTVECGRAHFDTESRRYTILDAPGHKNYVPNMISGAQQADVAILVISARRGEFEAGFDRGGQTREHGLLAMTLGISRVVVVVNKMDTCKWGKDRYDEIASRVLKFLVDDIGFKKKYVSFLPISGQTATNIKEPVSKDVCPWWKGQTLLETLDSLKKVKRATGNDLRIPILDRYKGDKGLQAIGKVEAGIIKKGDSVMIMPSEVTTSIANLSIDDAPVESVGAGENILITFDKGALSMDQIYSGCVICSQDEPTKVVESFLAEIYIHELPTGIMTSGYQAMFHCHNVSTMCEIEKIPHKLHKKTMKKSKMAPPFLRSHDRAIARIKLDQKCALEPYDDCAALGRFTLRDQGKTVVIGKIRSIFASKSRLKSKQRESKQDR